MNRSPYLAQGKRLKNSVADAVIRLHQEGFSYDFSMLENHSYLCLQSNKVYTQETANMTFIDEFYDRYTSNYKFIHTIETCCGIKGLIILNTIYKSEINMHTEISPVRHSLKQRLDPVTYNLIIDLFDKRSRFEDRLLVRYKDKILPIAFNDIAFFYLENELTKLVTFEKKTYIIQKTLDDLEKQAGIIFLGRTGNTW